jgi:hypothetical protein
MIRLDDGMPDPLGATCDGRGVNTIDIAVPGCFNIPHVNRADPAARETF